MTIIRKNENILRFFPEIANVGTEIALSIYSLDRILEIFIPIVAYSSTPENYQHHSGHIEEASRGDRGVRKGRFSIHSSLCALCASAWDFPGKYF